MPKAFERKARPPLKAGESPEKTALWVTFSAEENSNVKDVLRTLHKMQAVLAFVLPLKPLMIRPKLFAFLPAFRHFCWRKAD
jgi:hypothetical protein